MTYNPEIHHRRSIRLKNYDYSKNGAYFVTIVTQERSCLFGKIGEHQLVVNDAGRMIERWMQELSYKFRNITIDQYIIMPNHVHAILQNDGNVKILGADLRVHPVPDDNPNTTNNQDKHLVLPLHRIVQWFKTMTTNAYIQGVKNQKWTPFPAKLWQRNYYERVIRDENELNQIRQYILDNPIKWEYDQDNPNVIA